MSETKPDDGDCPCDDESGDATDSGATFDDCNPHLRAILNAVRGPAVVLDVDLNVQLANDAFCELFQETAEEIEGGTIYDVGNGDWEIDDLRDCLSGLSTESPDCGEFQVRKEFSDVGERSLKLSAKRLDRTPQTPDMVLLAVEDVTAARIAQFEEARLAAVVESSQDAIILQSSNGEILHWNSGAETIYGYTQSEMVGRTIDRVIPPERREEFTELRKRVLEGESVRQFESVRILRGGRELPVSVTISPVEVEPSVVSATSTIERDVSRRVRIERELQAAMEAAERADRTKSAFLANVSHELRTPMNAIIGMMDLALDDDLSEIVRDYLETARASAGVLLELLNNVLDFSKLESGRFELDSHPFVLRDVLDGVMKTQALRAYEKGLELACHASADVPTRVVGDEMRLRQVISNLVGNAVKFTEQGEVVVDVTRISAGPGDVGLRFSVRDTGVGVSQEDGERIFSPFTQVDSSTSRHYEGTGLGLAISRELIARMGGRLWLESEPGEGSTFVFTAHFKKTREEAGAASPQQVQVEQLKDLPVLVVDDNETNRLIIHEYLTNWSMKPECVSDARTALERLETASEEDRDFPLVITDALMPGVDGFTLVEKIKATPDVSTAAVLMVSSSDRQTFRDRCESLDVAAYLEKPVSQSDLLDSIVTALGGPVRETPAAGSRADIGPVRTLNILLAEDTPANQKVAVRILEKRGHRVRVAHNGRETIDLLEDDGFDVLLLDVQMPIMDGFQTAEAIRTQEAGTGRRLPIIAMTAHAMKGDREKCLASGMDSYISKPIDARKLVRLVEGLIVTPNGGRRAPRRSAAIRRDDSVQAENRAHDSQPGRTRAAIAVDLDAALARVGHDRELLDEMIELYFEDGPRLLKALDSAVESQDAAEVVRAAHSLKGLAANFDAHAVVEAAARLEELAGSRNLEDAPAAAETLRAENERLLEALAPHRLQDG